jgi:hypothetical protein
MRFLTVHCLEPEGRLRVDFTFANLRRLAGMVRFPPRRLRTAANLSGRLDEHMIVF